MRVLLISAPIGAGHMRAAEAVAAALKRRDADIETEITNIFSLVSPQFGKFILNGYLKILATVPKLYGRLYGWGNTNRLALWGRDMLNRYLAKKMYTYIKNYRPSVIICTHATPAGLSAYLLKKQLICIPVFAVVTDFVVHRLWVYPEISRYFVADDVLREYLFTKGVPFVRSQTTGIPVGYLFRKCAKRQAVLVELGLTPSVKTLLMMGGGAGILPMKELLKALESVTEELQVIVIAGNNARLYQELRKMEPALRHRVRVLGYIDNVHEIMSAADVLISKPGGVTVAEALSMRLPMILYRPIPGQEAANTLYLQNKGAALCAHSTAEATQFLHALLFEKNNQLLVHLQKNIQLLKRPLAADCIADTVLAESFS